MDTPANYKHPCWSSHKCHDWRNYISDEMRDIWETFTNEQKQVIARNAEDMADREEWD